MGYLKRIVITRGCTVAFWTRQVVSELNKNVGFVAVCLIKEMHFACSIQNSGVHTLMEETYFLHVWDTQIVSTFVIHYSILW